MTLREFTSKLVFCDYYKYIHIDGKDESDRYSSIKYMHHIINYITIDENGYHFYIGNETISEYKTFTFKDLINILDQSIIMKFEKKFYHNSNLEIKEIMLKDHKIIIK